MISVFRIHRRRRKCTPPCDLRGTCDVVSSDLTPSMLSAWMCSCMSSAYENVTIFSHDWWCRQRPLRGRWNPWGSEKSVAIRCSRPGSLLTLCSSNETSVGGHWGRKLGTEPIQRRALNKETAGDRTDRGRPYQWVVHGIECRAEVKQHEQQHLSSVLMCRYRRGYGAGATPVYNWATKFLQALTSMCNVTSAHSTV